MCSPQAMAAGPGWPMFRFDIHHSDRSETSIQPTTHRCQMITGPGYGDQEDHTPFVSLLLILMVTMWVPSLGLG